MPSSVEIILVPTVMILLGMFLKHLNFLKSEDSKLLNKIVLNISLPSLVFLNLSTASLSSEVIILPITGIFTVFLTALIAYLYASVRKYSKKTKWTIILASSMMNTAFIGYPVIMGVLGNVGFIDSIFYDMSIAILFVVYGMILAGVFGGSRKEVIYNGLTFMPLWAVVFGLLFNIFNIPMGYVLESSLNYLGQSTIFLIMLSLGLNLNVSLFTSNIDDSLFVLALRLLVAPLVVLIVFKLMNITNLIYNVAILDSAMPIAMNCLVLSITYDLDSEFMASVIFLSTLLCVVTLPVFIMFM